MNSSNDRNSSKPKKKKRNNKKKRRRDKKYDLSDPSLSDNSDSSYNSDYRQKRRKRKSDQKKDPIKLCAQLTKKLLTTAYKSNIIRFKMDEDPLQHRIYFLTFVESLEMIFLQYTETCEVLLDYPRIGGEDIKDFSREAIRNIFHANIYVHGRRLISKFPAYGIKCIEKLQSQYANMTFAEKVNIPECTGFISFCSKFLLRISNDAHISG